MAETGPRTVRCPICGKRVPRECPDFPFCSSRCRIRDLGHWAAGDYRIPGEPASIPDGAPTDDDDA